MPSNATETIDARILRLIGLEDIFDLDYDTYITLLKEAAVKGRMPKTTIPIEEVELLTEELKRVKSKKDKGRFKVKKTKVTAAALKSGRGILTGKKTSIPTSRLLPAAKEGGGGFNLSESFAKIAESVTSIAKTLKEKSLLSKKEAEFDRRADERERRKLQKDNLKKRFAKMAAVAQKILQPVQSLLDKLINYFVNIFLGMAVIKLLKWFNNDENKKKVKSFVRFIGDWWPALVGGWLLFGTGIGGLVASFVPMVVGWTAKLVGVVASNPILAAALALGTAGLWAPKLFPGLANEDERETDKQVKEHGKDNVRSDLERLSNNPNWLEKFQGKDIVAKEKLHYMDTGESKRYNNGGWIVPGSGSGDTVDAKLTPGEVVINKPTVDAFGPDYFLAHNSLYGGPNANKPQMMGGTMFASRGGEVGRESGSYRVPDWKDVGAKVLNWVGRASGEGYKMFGGATDWIGRASGEGYRMFGGAKDWMGRAAGEAKRIISPAMDWMGRAAGEGKKMISPTINNIIEVVSGIPGGIHSLATNPELTSSAVGFADAGAEAVPAILAGFLGIKRTDKSISTSMQRGILEAAKRAGVTQGGNKNIDYGHYGDDAGGIAGKYTMGRIGANEFKYDSKGRIIGLRQEYDTNRPANESMIQATIATKRFFGLDYKQDVDKFNNISRKRMISEGMGKHFNPLKVEGGKFQMGDIKTALYKPFEALLDISQKMHGGRGSTTHDLDFSENVLGFKPEKAQIAKTQKPNTPPPPPPESFANTGTGSDGTFGEGTYGEGRPSDPSPSTPSIPNIPVIGGWLDKLNVLGLGG